MSHIGVCEPCFGCIVREMSKIIINNISNRQLNTIFKKKRRIIHPHFTFMTVKSVYEPDLPFHKPFFLEKVGKGL